MNAQQRRLALWAVLGGALILALIALFAPRAVLVDIQDVALSTLVVSVDDEGETRVRDIFVLSSPVAGRMLRIEAEAGDAVVSESDFKPAFKAAAEFTPGVAAFANVLNLHADGAGDTVQGEVAFQGEQTFAYRGEGAADEACFRVGFDVEILFFA